MVAAISGAGCSPSAPTVGASGTLSLAAGVAAGAFSHVEVTAAFPQATPATLSLVERLELLDGKVVLANGTSGDFPVDYAVSGRGSAYLPYGKLEVRLRNADLVRSSDPLGAATFPVNFCGGDTYCGITPVVNVTIDFAIGSSGLPVWPDAYCVGNGGSGWGGIGGSGDVLTPDYLCPNGARPLAELDTQFEPAVCCPM